MAIEETILELLGEYGYLLVFAAGMVEGLPFVGMFIPGQSVIILAGFLASQGVLDIWQVIIAATLAGILGDATSYFIGHWKGRPFLIRYGPRFHLREAHVHRADDLFARYGPAALLLGRFSFVTRGLVSLLAGITGMRQIVYWPLNLAGAIGWSLAYTGMGFLFGGSVKVLEGILGRTVAGILAVLVVGYVVVRLVRRWRKWTLSGEAPE